MGGKTDPLASIAESGSNGAGKATEAKAEEWLLRTPMRKLENVESIPNA